MTDTHAPLSFTYTGAAEPGTMDQTLDIQHAGSEPVAPTLVIEALDDRGEVLDDITVRTAYGSTAGELVAFPGHNVDILAFDGPDRGRVADVRVTVEAAPVVALRPTTQLIRATPVRGDQPVEPGEAFDGVLLVNANDGDVPVRVVYLVWGPIEEGLAQQVAVRRVAVDRAIVKGHGGVRAAVDPGAVEMIAEVARTGGAASLKPFVLAIDPRFRR